MNRQLTPVVKNIIIINVIFFLGTAVLPDQIALYLGGHYFKSDLFAPWQIVTHMFMHGGLMHIFFNMLILFFFGPTLEQLWGPKRFLIYYMVTGVGAYVLHFLVVHLQVEALMVKMDQRAIQEVMNNGIDVLMQNKNYVGDKGELNRFWNGSVVGASGAVYGVLLAFGMLFPNTQLMLLFPPIPIRAKYLVMFLAVFAFIMAVSNNPGDNVAHFAHLGGMLFGYLLLKYWQKNNGSFY